MLYYMQDLSDFRGHEDQLYNKSVSPGAAMFKAREPVFPCTANSRNKANHLQRESNCFLPQGVKTVKLDRCCIGVSDVISCNTSVLIVSGNPARTLESQADRWVIYRLSWRDNDYTNKDIKY